MYSFRTELKANGDITTTALGDQIQRWAVGNGEGDDSAVDATADGHICDGGYKGGVELGVHEGHGPQGAGYAGAGGQQAHQQLDTPVSKVDLLEDGAALHGPVPVHDPVDCSDARKENPDDVPDVEEKVGDEEGNIEYQDQPVELHGVARAGVQTSMHLTDKGKLVKVQVVDQLVDQHHSRCDGRNEWHDGAGEVGPVVVGDRAQARQHLVGLPLLVQPLRVRIVADNQLVDLLDVERLEEDHDKGSINQDKDPGNKDHHIWKVGHEYGYIEAFVYISQFLIGPYRLGAVLTNVEAVQCALLIYGVYIVRISTSFPGVKMFIVTVLQTR